MADEHLEIERKYQVPDDWRLPPLADALSGLAPSPPQLVHLRSEYFDTADRDLVRFGVTLRRRSGDDDLGWQLKVPGELGRTEIRHPESEAMPAELSAILLGLTRGAALQPLVIIRTERTRHRWFDADGALVLEVADDSVHGAAPATQSADLTAWREIEVEVGPRGDPADLDRVEALLLDSGAQPSADVTKVHRALGHTDETGVDLSGHAAAEPLAYLRTQDEALILGDLRLRSGDDDVHATRVATRRMRSTLRLFAELFDSGAAAELDDELAWYAGVLGEVRDRQVQRRRLAAAVAELPEEWVLGPVAGTIEQTLLSEQLRAVADLRSAMNSDRYLRLLQLSAAFTTRPPLIDRDDHHGKNRTDVTAEVIRRAAKKAIRKLDTALATNDDELLHKARKAAKRARYAAELSDRKRHRKVAKKFKTLQTILGDHQDSAVTTALLRRLGAAAATDPTQNGFTYGLLHERELTKAAQSRSSAERWRKSV